MKTNTAYEKQTSPNETPTQIEVKTEINLTAKLVVKISAVFTTLFLRLHKWIKTDGFGREEWERIEYRKEHRERKANRAYDENWFHIR